jgi:hypothetical protein
MDALENIYYIIIQNNPYAYGEENDTYHLEKIFSREQILEIIEENKKDGDNFNLRHFSIVTNDPIFLNRYIFTINFDELKLLCNIPEYESSNIRLNSSFFYGFPKTMYSYFLKIYDGEIISANQYWTFIKDDPYLQFSDGFLQYQGWVENIKFIYFKTHKRYSKEHTTAIFHNENYKQGNIEVFKKLLNINILDIGKNSNSDVNWEWFKGKLRYYDKISSRRLYITEQFLQILRNDNTINFLITTTLDENFYIEYTVTGIDYPLPLENVEFEFEEEEEEEEEEREREESGDFSYDKYKGAYGYDDDSINSAFEGHPENYWNID